MKQFLLLLIVVCLASACGEKYDPVDQLAEDIVKIEAYIAEKGFTDVQMTDSGLHYQILEEGVGTEYPTTTSNVTCDYVGRLLEDDLIVFDAGAGVTFNLTQVIRGWTEGIPKLKREGSGRFFVPSTLAYGNVQQSQTIDKNSVLIFDVTLNHFWD